MESEAYWIDFFKNADIDDSDALCYAKIFITQKIRPKILHRLTAEKLESLGIIELGNQESILNYIEGNNDANISKTNSEGDSPKKKNSRVDLFLEEINESTNIVPVVAKAVAVISNLEAECVYNQFSDKSCHKMAKYCPSLPSYHETEEIEIIFKDSDIDPDIPAVACVQFFLQPLPMPQVSVSMPNPTEITNALNLDRN